MAQSHERTEALSDEMETTERDDQEGGDVSSPPGSIEIPSPPPAGSSVYGDWLPTAIAYHHLLATDGIVRGLIGPREVPRLWDRHVLNCAVIEEAIPEASYVVDIGSGAGLPGLALAIARPDLRICLVEPLLRRATFLSDAVDSLGLENVRVVRGRAEEKAVRDQVGEADVVTSRAVAPLERLVKWSAPLIRTGGQLIAIKGSSVAEEIERDAAASRKAGVVNLRTAVCGADHLEDPTTILIGDKVAVGGSQAKKKRRK